MTLQGEPQSHRRPTTEWQRRFRSAVAGKTPKVLLLAGSMVVAVVLTPPFPGQGPEASGPQPTISLEAASVERHVAPAVVSPPMAQQPPAAVIQMLPEPAAWTIYVAGSGGQELVDACIGPVHYTPTDAYSLFITEHDYCGGWARFSGIGVGQKVTLAGYGTYTVGAIGQVPLGGTTSHVSEVFGGFPRAVLQTCIPGTSQMLVIALN